jgi:hypothetical protein
MTIRFDIPSTETLREALPYGGDWGVVWLGDDHANPLLWVCVTPAGEMTLNDANTSVAIEDGEDIDAAARAWIRATS